MWDGACATHAALARVRAEPTILDALEALEGVVASARVERAATLDVLAAGIADRDDPLVAVAAVYAAGAAGVDVAEPLLVPLLAGPDAYLREHAAWALAAADPVPAAVAPLQAMAARGDFAGALAQATLERWSDQPDLPDVALRDPSCDALTIAHMYLHGDIDGTLRHSGRGDTGGIATLLVQLGDALLREPQVDRVLTLSRSRECEPVAPRGPGHHFLGIPVPQPAPPASRSWTLRGHALAGLRRLLTEAGPVDVLHLRMADVGSWAGAQVARELGIPVVLTLAPDPHALLAAREAAGALTRASFAAADLVEHLVFRVRLLRELREQAAALVVFPRPDLDHDLRTLLHVDPEQPVHVIPEGIDIDALDEADRQVARGCAGGTPTPTVATALAELDVLLAELPPHRRHLPLVLSVGRLHPVKGMATLARAWAADPDLSARCNLVIVGGDLDQPTSDESEQVALIDAVVPCDDPARCGLLLAGHRANSTVATWLAAARRGRPGFSAPGGVYACASVKEEFGIALCEALGSGLVAVAPDQGGPPTYIEHGVTGVLVDTTDVTALGAAIGQALDLSAGPEAAARAERARQIVVDRFSIRTMAGALAGVYEGASRVLQGARR